MGWKLMDNKFQVLTCFSFGYLNGYLIKFNYLESVVFLFIWPHHIVV